MVPCKQQVSDFPRRWCKWHADNVLAFPDISALFSWFYMKENLMIFWQFWRCPSFITGALWVPHIHLLWHLKSDGPEVRTHERMHACLHSHTHTRTHARTHAELDARVHESETTQQMCSCVRITSLFLKHWRHDFHVVLNFKSA